MCRGRLTLFMFSITTYNKKKKEENNNCVFFYKFIKHFCILCRRDLIDIRNTLFMLYLSLKIKHILTVCFFFVFFFGWCMK